MRTLDNQDRASLPIFLPQTNSTRQNPQRPTFSMDNGPSTVD